jgi:hypothetical protein
MHWIGLWGIYITQIYFTVSKYILHHAHGYGPISNIMTLIHCATKGHYMDTLKQYYIQKDAYNRTLIPEQCVGGHNSLFVLINTLPRNSYSTVLPVLPYTVLHRLPSTMHTGTYWTTLIIPYTIYTLYLITIPLDIIMIFLYFQTTH